MAEISIIAIPGLTWDSSNQEAIMDNNNRILQFQIGLVRDVDGWTYLTTWTKADIKIKIEDAQGGVLIEDTSWTQISDDNFKYNTSDGNYGRYSIITFQRQLNFVFSNIGKITIWCKRRNASDNDYYKKTLNFLTDETPLYQSVWVGGKSSFSTLLYTYTYKKPIYASKVCSVSNPSEIKIKGKNDDYTNSKYHNGTIKFEFPSITYMGVPRYPQQIKLSAGEKEYIVIPQEDVDYAELSINPETKIIAPYDITLYIGNASYTKTVNTGIYPLSSFVEQELDLSEMTAIAYDISNVVEQDPKYWITQRSIVSGGIKIKDLENSPYIFENNKSLSLIVTDVNDNEEKVDTEKIYTITGNKISLGNYYPFQSHTYDFNGNSGNWRSDQTFFEKAKKYALILEATSKFDSSLKSIEIPIDNYINYNAAPIILSKALDYKVKYGDKSCGDTMILNPYETLEVSINNNYVFFPNLQNNWEQSDSNIADYKIYYTLSQQQDYYLNWENSVTNEVFSQTHEQILNLEEDHYTKFLTFGLKVEEGSNSAAQKMNTVRIGRVQPMVISKCEIKGDTLTYYLSDYGGDKTANLPASTFIPYDSSLSRSGNEYLYLTLYGKDDEWLGDISIETEPNEKANIRKYFYENIPIKIQLSDFSWSQEGERSAEIIKITGEYHYSYLEEPNEEQIITFEISGATLVNLANNPTWSLREHGIIINGTPKKELSSVKNSEGEKIGTYFFEINALEQDDRIIVNFPIEGSTTTVSGEIYYNSEKNKIILKGFELE